MEARSCNHWSNGKAINITYYECIFVALDIQRAMRMYQSHLWPVRLCQTFTHYLINCTIIEHKLLNIKFLFWFSLQILSEKLLIVGRNERNIIINAHNFHVKFPLFLPDFNETWISSTDFRKILKISIFMKMDQAGADMFTADRRTDMTKLIVAFNHFAKAL